MHQEFDPRDLEPSLPTREERQSRSRLAPVMIAAVALAGFGGVVWYAYDQGVRQAAGPTATLLIKADSGPTKVRPEQPGGMEVPHQDKLVLNTLANPDKAGAAPVERLLPPPETPLPRPPAGASAAPVAASPPVSPSLPPKIGPTPPTPAGAAPSVPAAAIPAPTPAMTQTASVPAAAPTPKPAAPAADKAAPDKVQTAAAPTAAAKPTPAAPTSGAGFRVQLVSVKSQNETGAEWARLQRSYPELAPLHMSVMRVDLGEKGVWYRIYGGPLSDAAAAGHLCDALKAKNQGCMVVKP